MLLTKPYDVVNERMIGDIDVLVKEKDIVKTQNLLIKNGFKARFTILLLLLNL